MPENYKQNLTVLKLERRGELNKTIIKIKEESCRLSDKIHKLEGKY